MRPQYREILEEAVAASASREDFDEMLLRATKRHLPVRYHAHFLSMLEEILARAERQEMTNRQAAREILASMETPEPSHHSPDRSAEPARAVQRPAMDVPAAGTLPVPPVELKRQSASPPGPAREKGEAPAETAEEPQGSDMGTEAPKILDLGGVRPDTLSAELRDKLSKLVKARKQKADWEDTSGDEAQEGLFFKGKERCPPQVPPKKPAKPAAEKGDTEGSAEPQDDSEEE